MAFATPHPLRCANCGASIEMAPHPGSVVSCAYCKTTFRIPTTPTPEPQLGDLMLGTDFTSIEQRGWARAANLQYELCPGPVPELLVRDTSRRQSVRSLIWTPAHFDDFDIGATFRRVEAVADTQVGLLLRFGPDGWYGVALTFNKLTVYFADPSKVIETLVPWVEHNAIRQEPGALNRLRAVVVGDRLRVYINGVLALSLRDTRRRAGSVNVVLGGSEVDVAVAVSDIALREPPRA